MTKQHGLPFLLSALDSEFDPKPLTPFPHTAKSKESTSYEEKWLQQLISRHPEILPFVELGEPTFAGATRSICTELPISGKAVDNLLITDNGALVLVECKLWRNPEARRAVVGQILEYAVALSRWSYEQLDAAVRRARPPRGVSKEASLYSRAKSLEGLEEREFIDQVNASLKRGRFLLLVVGDGIRENVEAIAGFLQSHAGLRFTFGIVEMAVYQLPDRLFLVQPRVLAHTTKIERGVVALEDDRLEVRPPITSTISEDALFRQLDEKEGGLGARLQSFVQRMGPAQVSIEVTASAIRLLGRANDDLWPLTTIDPKQGTAWFERMVGKAKAAGRYEEAMTFYKHLVDLLDSETLRGEKLAPGTKSGVRSLPLSLLLRKPEQWGSAIEEYLRAVSVDRSV